MILKKNGELWIENLLFIVIFSQSRGVEAVCTPKGYTKYIYGGKFSR